MIDSNNDNNNDDGGYAGQSDDTGYNQDAAENLAVEGNNTNWQTLQDAASLPVG